MELAGSGAPGVEPWAPVFFSTLQADASIARAVAATIVCLARDIESGPFARVYLRRAAGAAVVVPTPVEPAAFHPGYTPVLGPGVGTGRRCGLKSHGPKGR